MTADEAWRKLEVWQRRRVLEDIRLREDFWARYPDGDYSTRLTAVLRAAGRKKGGTRGR
jgi:hypothetical protein